MVKFKSVLFLLSLSPRLSLPKLEKEEGWSKRKGNRRLKGIIGKKSREREKVGQKREQTEQKPM